mmetsp:Transcript_20517/g.45270  ORF Transcript_20517/g.45270 Transcript_20517/m.45270 type:complete len:397 (+) Transcript_20517:503-1693(+)
MGSLLAAIFHVLLQGQVEQHGLLTHEANLLPPPTHIQLLQVSAPHCDETLLRIIKPQKELNHSGFSTARVAYQCHLLPLADVQAHLAQDQDLRTVRVVEPHLLQADTAISKVSNFPVRLNGIDLGALVDQAEDLLGRHDPGGAVREVHGHDAHEHHPEDHSEECQQHFGRVEVTAADHHARQTEADQVDQRNHTAGETESKGPFHRHGSVPGGYHLQGVGHDVQGVLLGPQRPHGADVGDRLGGGLRGRGVGQLRAGVHLGRRRGQDGAEAEAYGKDGQQNQRQDPGPEKTQDNAGQACQHCSQCVGQVHTKDLRDASHVTLQGDQEAGGLILGCIKEAHVHPDGATEGRFPQSQADALLQKGEQAVLDKYADAKDDAYHHQAQARCIQFLQHVFQ